MSKLRWNHRSFFILVKKLNMEQDILDGFALRDKPQKDLDNAGESWQWE